MSQPLLLSLTTLPVNRFPSWAAPDRDSRLTWAFVWLGVVLRVVTFALNYPLWGDEAFVAVNFLNRGYRDLLRPLDYGQVSPILFLWLELTAVKLFGFSEWSLRLVPTVCSVTSVFVFAHLVGRLVAGRGRVLAVAIFAVSLYPIRHGAEVKPYAVDLLVALGLLTLAVEWYRAPEQNRWLWGLVAAVAPALGLSHPAVFVAGGVSLGLAGTAWNRRKQGAWPLFLLYNFTLVATFLALFLFFTGEQQRACLPNYRSHYWSEAFPPVHEPGKLIRWLAETHTGRMFAYPLGDARGGSSFTSLCFAIGLFSLWRRRQFWVLVLALAPFGLAFLAALMGRYPYGGSVRTMIFVAPAICLLSGSGLASMIGRLRYRLTRRWAFRMSVVGLAAIGTVLLALKVSRPYKDVSDQKSRAFAQWFWTEKARDAELVCVKTDLGTGFDHDNWTLFRSALYLCNQRIYSPRHRRGAPANWETISSARPLRCVLYNEWPEIAPACEAWLQAMTQGFELRRRETFVVNNSGHRDDGTDFEDRYTVLEFVPRSKASPLRLAQRALASAPVR